MVSYPHPSNRNQRHLMSSKRLVLELMTRDHQPRTEHRPPLRPWMVYGLTVSPKEILKDLALRHLSAGRKQSLDVQTTLAPKSILCPDEVAMKVRLRQLSSRTPRGSTNLPSQKSSPAAPCQPTAQRHRQWHPPPKEPNPHTSTTRPSQSYPPRAVDPNLNRHPTLCHRSPPTPRSGARLPRIPRMRRRKSRSHLPCRKPSRQRSASGRASWQLSSGSVCVRCQDRNSTPCTIFSYHLVTVFVELP